MIERERERERGGGGGGGSGGRERIPRLECIPTIEYHSCQHFIGLVHEGVGIIIMVNIQSLSEFKYMH